MLEKPYSITPLNESAALVSFGNVIDEAINQKVIALHQHLREKPFSGFLESVPAYSSLAIFYDAFEIIHSNTNTKSTFDFVREYLEDILSKLTLINEQENNQIIKIPVLYDGEDLRFVADQHQLAINSLYGNSGRSYCHSTKKFTTNISSFRQCWDCWFSNWNLSASFSRWLAIDRSNTA